ncbi:MAG: Rne/Rng family ribonuclease [Chitinophagaceae bacterium]
MSKKLIIKKSNQGLIIALLEDKRLIELHTDTKSSGTLNLGDVYLGKVKKFIPGMNAAFIDIGIEKNGFLHYTDLNAQIKSYLHFIQQAQQKQKSFDTTLSNFKFLQETTKSGKITDVFKAKPFIVAQVFKEPIAQKGPRLSTDISLPGRYIVLMPLFKKHISISKKIELPEERNRLIKIAKTLCPNNFKVIIRTAAENISEKEIAEDIKHQINIWEKICQELWGATQVKKLYGNTKKITTVLREILDDDFAKIIVNNKAVYEEAKTYLEQINSDKVNIIELHKEGDIFDTYEVNKQIKTLFGKTVSLPNLSGSIVIEHTEAMHVIDVNSGFKTIGTNQEENALKNNLLAADEIARQFKLRDIGGIIAIDFINMNTAESRKAVFKRMHELLALDKTKHNILPISKFGVMMITRKRVKPELKINTLELCPTCHGTGKISNSIQLEEEILQTIKFLSLHHYKKIKLHVHPIIYAYFTKGICFSKINLLRWQLKQWIYMLPDSKLQLTEYHIFDKNKEEIKVN